VANEIDPASINILNAKKNFDDLLATIDGRDFFELADEAKNTSRFDVANSTFADHHFDPIHKHDFLENIKQMLKENGSYILGDEFLPPHNEADIEERLNALISYHGMIIEEAFKEGKVELPKLERDALISGLRTAVRFIQQTVPSDVENEFAAAPGDNNYNQSAVQLLDALIKRLAVVKEGNLGNPEHLPEVSLAEKRGEFIERLVELRSDLQQSPRAGLIENGEKGGDYKMTIRQYVDFLNQAGLNAVGYFEGPQAEQNETLDKGRASEAIALNSGENHAGGVWVLKVERNKNISGADIKPAL
jgi:hypothetical protein